MKRQPIEITVTVFGLSATWEGRNLTNVMRQARIEADRGALVRVTQGERLIWTNEVAP